MNIATEITGGIFCALISGLLMLFTNGLIKDLSLLLLLYALIHDGLVYPWERCLYNNEHLVVLLSGTLGGVNQFPTLGV